MVVFKSMLTATGLSYLFFAKFLNARKIRSFSSFIKSISKIFKRLIRRCDTNGPLVLSYSGNTFFLLHRIWTPFNFSFRYPPILLTEWCLKKKRPRNVFLFSARRIQNMGNAAQQVFQVDGLRRLILSFFRTNAEKICAHCHAICVWDIKIITSYVSYSQDSQMVTCNACFQNYNGPGCNIS